jgi:hypothetical protein
VDLDRRRGRRGERGQGERDHHTGKRTRPPVDAMFARRSMARRLTPADDGRMQEIMRIVDSDERSLAVRVEAALAVLGPHAVTRFTLWYTTRPPVHHAVLRAEAPPQ